MQKIIVTGHSAGGITCLLAGVLDERVKASLALDPWFFPINEDADWDKW